jgi:hypothetical protein
MRERIIQPQAEAAIYCWYENQKVGLGDEFAAALTDQLHHICDSQERRVVVIGAVHDNRRPRIWRRRLREEGL